MPKLKSGKELRIIRRVMRRNKDFWTHSKMKVNKQGAASLLERTQQSRGKARAGVERKPSSLRIVFAQIETDDARQLANFFQSLPMAIGTATK